MKRYNNRYAWTNYGPVTIMGGGEHSTSKVRTWLKKEHGLTVERWARNWAEFLGWQDIPLYMDASHASTRVK